MKPNWHVFENQKELAKSFAAWFQNFINNYPSDIVHVALSGGNTPIKLYQTLTTISYNFLNDIQWEKIFFFWGDERCVSPSDPQSNYGAAFEYLFSRLPIETDQVFRIKGEEKPAVEAYRYSQLIKHLLPKKSDFPQFDLIILGVGDDGHTASIFPNQMQLLHSENICEVATHPVLGQHRITLTGPVLNHAKNLAFLVSGNNKKNILADIYQQNKQSKKYPVSFINQAEQTHWFIDKNAAQLLL